MSCTPGDIHIHDNSLANLLLNPGDCLLRGDLEWDLRLGTGDLE